jgi:hypothetical protein
MIGEAGNEEERVHAGTDHHRAEGGREETAKGQAIR